MTLDTAALRAQWEAIREQRGPQAFAMIAHVGDGIALLDALDEERERVRVVTALLIGANDDINHVRVRTQRDADRLYAAKDKVGRAVRALATAGGEGATT